MSQNNSTGSTPGVPRSRSASGRAGSRRDPARAVEPATPAPRPPALGAGEALYDAGIHRTLSDPGLSRPRPSVRAPPRDSCHPAPPAAAPLHPPPPPRSPPPPSPPRLPRHHTHPSSRTPLSPIS
ncbi:unnamed protein product [Leptosia nina]|uniref:Uncharacterized protein n=1 Tax=Leptosia nina TaxID=320188 RepID=A0AAV1JVD2_9NEOP